MTIHSCDLCGLWPFCLLLELDDHGKMMREKWMGGFQMRGAKLVRNPRS